MIGAIVLAAYFGCLVGLSLYGLHRWVLVALYVRHRRHGHRARMLRIPHGGLSVALVVCFILAVLAGTIGLAAIVGAYLAGLVVAELSDELELKRDLDAIRALLVPFFFVLTGMRFDLSAVAAPDALVLGIVLTVAAILTKIVGCGLAMWGTSLRSAVRLELVEVSRRRVDSW